LSLNGLLRWFARAGHLDPADAREMASWDHGGGFCLDASVRIEGHDGAGLERLLRYCARPPFALERLEQFGNDELVYRFPKPQPDGRTALRLMALSTRWAAEAQIRGGHRRSTSIVVLPAQFVAVLLSNPVQVIAFHLAKRRCIISR